MKIKTLIMAGAVAAGSILSASAATTKESKAVRDIITKVNDHWQATHPAEHNAFWDEAASHTIPNGSTIRRNGRSITNGKAPKAPTDPSGNTTTARPTTMCSSATGRYASRHMPTSTTSFPTTGASSGLRK